MDMFLCELRLSSLQQYMRTQRLTCTEEIKALGGTTQPTETSATETKVSQVIANLGIRAPSKQCIQTKHNRIYHGY